MRCYFAPMEGLTDSIFRSTHHKYFGGVDAYFMPFLSPTMHRCLTHKEDRELPMADSVPFRAVPQILTKSAEDFLWAAEVCAQRGYDEVNLNLGCPSGTVVSKSKGSGMLRDLTYLDSFFAEIFQKSPLPISVKTRLGLEDPEEFYTISALFNRYPIKELTVHPRVRKQFYDGNVHLDMFRHAYEISTNPLCYNGDLFCKSDISKLSLEFPKVEAVMLGRGLVADPGMLLPHGTQIHSLRAFHNELLQRYTEAFGGARNAIFRLKENWHYLAPRFENSDKLWKKLRKTTDIGEFTAITEEIFATLPLKTQ